MEMKASTRSNNAPSRRMIPRPWLNRNREVEKLKTASLDILDTPTWTVSWSKLSSCFCIREQSDDERHNGFRDASQFPTFPAVRRDASVSSSSSPDLEDSGSLSSFTASDDSSSSSSFEEAYFQSPAPPLPPSRTRVSTAVSTAATPPPPPPGKPPMTTRCRSPALPPRGSSVTNAPTKFLAPRARCDTGEFSKTSTNTNNSRHRRLDQFTFSGDSIDRILKGAEEQAVPPPVVLCQGTRRPYLEEPEDSGYVSQLDDDDQEDLDDCEEFWKKQGHEHDSHSPFSQLERKTEKEQEEMQQLAASPIPKRQSGPDPVYLCKSERLDRSSTGRVILSGWIAASVGDNSLEANLVSGFKLRLKDIYYMRIVEENEQASLVFHNSKGDVAHLLRPELGWSCQPKEISSRVGRSILLNDPSRSTVATLLPVSLKDCFFSRGELVSSKQFSKLHSQLFANGSGKVYAPDEQHDAAMFIMFSLDALIKGCRR